MDEEGSPLAPWFIYFMCAYKVSLSNISYPFQKISDFSKQTKDYLALCTVLSLNKGFLYTLAQVFFPGQICPAAETFNTSGNK